MDTCSRTFCPVPGCKATTMCFMNNFRNAVLALAETSGKDNHHIPKPLTKGAIYMILVIFVAVLFAVAGTSITLGEFFFTTEKKTPNGSYSSRSIKNSTKESKKNSSEHHYFSKAWVNKLKSFLCCFCVLNNGKKLLGNASYKYQFECFDGIRFLCNFWTILIHICMAYISSLRYIYELKPVAEMWSFQLLLNGHYAVDAFFFLGGFLNAYMFFGNYDKSKGNVSLFYFYFKRFARLTPVYMIVLGFYTVAYPYLGSGPLWPTFDTNPVCRQSWWWNLLYINNFRSHTAQCMEWCWYLAADMQFYIISPLFLISLQRRPRLGYILIGAFTATSCFTNFILTKRHNLLDGVARLKFHFDDYYSFANGFLKYFEVIHTKPYSRIIGYLFGILLAHYLYNRRFDRIKCNQGVLLIGWIGTGIFWFLAYSAVFLREESSIEIPMYNGVKFLFYSIGLSWTIFACVRGQGGILNKFLSWKVFVPLARLSYCAYLIHPIILVRYFQTAEHLSTFTISSLLAVSAYVYFWTYIFSIITFLLFEIPFSNMMDLLSVKAQAKVLKIKD